jgi:Spy/CpxP family protein refolding chaperone
MKKLYAIFPILLAAALVVPHAPAQNPSSTTPTADTSTTKVKKSKSSGTRKTSGRADSELADLSTKLNLTDDQKAKIRPILDDKVAKIHTVKMDKTGSADDQKAKNKVIRESSDAQVRALLTPDQQKTFDETSKKGGKKKDAPSV